MNKKTKWMEAYQEEIIERKKSLKHVQGAQERVQTLYRIAELYREIKQFSEAEKYCEILYQYCKENKLEKDYSRVLYLLGLNNFSMDRYGMALEYYFEALPLYKKYFDNQEVSVLLNEIGRNYHRVHDQKKALTFYEEALKYYNGNAKYYSNLAPIYLMEGDAEKAFQYHIQAEKLAIETGDKAALAQNHANLGNYYKEKQDIEKAMDNYKKSRQEFEEMGWYNYMAQVQIEIGILQYQMGKREDGLETLKSTVEIAREVKRDVLVSRCYKHIATIYEIKGDMKQALHYTHLSHKIKDQYYSQELYKKLGEINLRYENSSRELRAKQMLERATHLASIGVMTAGITHEINQPLNAIKICADSLLFSEEMKPGTIPSAYLEDIEQISESAKRIEEIIKHLRSYWERNSDDKETDSVIKINSGIKKVLELLDKQLISHGIELGLKLGGEDHEVLCSRIQLEQIIINLLNNSQQALNSIHQDKKLIEIKTWKIDSGEVMLRVCDNGPGIKQEIIKHIFDPFFTTKKRGKGMGLGLAIVKEILDGIGGKIEVEKHEPRGICFLIHFPGGSD